MPSTNVNSAPAEEKKKKRSGFFGLGKKKKNSDGSSTVRKTKFKKIKGFLRGESKKSKGGSKTQTPPDTPTSPPAPKKDDDDASSTVYNVDVDDRSIASNSTAPRTDTSLLGSESEALLGLKRSMLKVVLLLMDPMTRRFELLQLEFDSEKALVSDVLAQIPLSVTEPSLRTQTFEGIVGKDGQEMTHHQLLAEKVSGNEVLVAVPKGSNAKDCSRLARPILGDDKVVTMLKSSGIDASVWKDLRKRKSTKHRLPRSTPTPTIQEEEPAPPKKTKSSFPWAAVLFWMFVLGLLGALHWYTFKPIQRGERVLPGIWKSKCGLLPFDPECDNEYLFVGFDGKVTGYDKDFEKTWEMTGGVCGNEPDCTPGLVVTPKGDIQIGSERVLYINFIQRGVDLDSGFPFATKPRIKRS